ncbi:MAG: PASTA domain-containing protein [Clostridiales bacterium]|nr:PASTA domain-containing protein [Candidatus Equinaster intestinalis]
MKKIFCIIMALLLTFAFVGCKAENTAAELSGKTAEEVLDWALSVGIEGNLKYEFEYSDSVPAGQVVSQSLKKGESLENGITVVISQGAAPTEIVGGTVAVPNCIGRPLCEGIEECAYAGIGEGETIYKKSSLPTGTILLTDPLPGSNLEFDAGSVNFICSEQIEGSKKLAVFVNWENDGITEPQVSIKAFTGGKELTDKAKTVDSNKNNTALYFEATGGKQELEITINDTITKKYTLDFDAEEYEEK